MIRAAALVSGGGAKLQAVLDCVYFGEIPDFELAAVICTEEDAYALQRAKNAGVPGFAVDPSDFPTAISYSMAISNKLRDMDIDLVVLAGYDMPLGIIANQFRNRVIGTFPALVPAFEDSADPVRAALERGCKLSGATAYFADSDGHVGPVILQQAVEVMPDDDVDTLSRRITEEAEWKLLPKALILYCENRLEIHGGRTVIK